MPVLQGGRTVRGVVQGDSRPRDFIPRLVDLFMEGHFPLDRLITAYDFAEINQAAADATHKTTAAKQAWIIYSRPFHGDPHGLLLETIASHQPLNLATTLPGVTVYRAAPQHVAAK